MILCVTVMRLTHKHTCSHSETHTHSGFIHVEVFETSESSSLFGFSDSPPHYFMTPQDGANNISRRVFEFVSDIVFNHQDGRCTLILFLLFLIYQILFLYRAQSSVVQQRVEVLTAFLHNHTQNQNKLCSAPELCGRFYTWIIITAIHFVNQTLRRSRECHKWSKILCGGDVRAETVQPGDSIQAPSFPVVLFSPFKDSFCKV